MNEERRLVHTRAHRILRKSEFQRVMNEGSRGTVRGLTLVILEVGTPPSRLGLAVSRRLGNAVKRNRARRLLREAFRLSAAEIPSGLDIVAMPQPEGFPNRLAPVRELFRRVLDRALSNAARRQRRPPAQEPRR